MRVEHEIKVIPIDASNPTAYQEAVQQLSKDGYELIPGILPMAIWYVCRRLDNNGNPIIPAAVAPATMATQAITPALGINDLSIGILKPDGYVHYPDGRVEKAQ